MKPNFEIITRQELKSYVLAHRDDREAIDLKKAAHTPQLAAIGISSPPTARSAI
jgi:hypothetical protein